MFKSFQIHLRINEIATVSFEQTLILSVCASVVFRLKTVVFER